MLFFRLRTPLGFGASIFAATLLWACERQIPLSLTPTVQGATPGQILSGRKIYDRDGALLLGTAPDFGDLDLQRSLPSGPGFFSSIRYAAFISNYCTTTQVVGAPGSAICSATASELLISGMAHDIDPLIAHRLSVDEESRLTGDPAGYRSIPDVTEDDDGVNTQTPGESKTTPSSRASVDCGLTQVSIDERIQDCTSKNPVESLWNGEKQGNNGNGAWRMVSAIAGEQVVWRDETTGLLWSDIMNFDFDSGVVAPINWCQASGNHQSNDPSNICNDPANQDQVAPVSACAEEGANRPFLGTEDYAHGIYAASKGGLGLRSTPSVRWRLPTYHEALQAQLDGALLVNSVTLATWTSTVVSGDRGMAWESVYGPTKRSRNLMSTDIFVNCVGSY